jgi:hypothetical protein
MNAGGTLSGMGTEHPDYAASVQDAGRWIQQAQHFNAWPLAKPQQNSAARWTDNAELVSNGAYLLDALTEARKV